MASWRVSCRLQSWTFALRSSRHNILRPLQYPRRLSTLPKYAIFEALSQHNPANAAVVHAHSGRTFTYGQLVEDVSTKAEELVTHAGRSDGQLKGERVAMLIENSYDYVVNMLSIIASDAIAVPLSPAFPIDELRYVLNHSQSLLLLSTSKFADKARETLKDGLDNAPIHIVAQKATERPTVSERPSLREPGAANESGIMLYTSGTTSQPKGVLLPTTALDAQCLSLNQAWSYSPKDYLLHILPLHHIHGVVNAILAPILAGSTIEFMFPFSPDAVWSRLAAPFLRKPSQKPITFLTVVPTVYNRLLATHAHLPSATKAALTKALHPSVLRLNISGSAALPTPTKAAWTSLTGGNVLLERYGMTEVGMALSCGLPFPHRPDGSVGWPLPSVEARLVDPEDASTVIDASSEAQGEIQLRGPCIFSQYWRDPVATSKAFTEDGWFKTGDVAVRKKVVEGMPEAWHILGRASADIIKTGGEKISALEVEREILSLPGCPVAEVAVVGLPSERWGQKVAAVAKMNDKEVTLLELRRRLKGRLAGVKLPMVLKVVEEIPKNAMGKVNKKMLVEEVFVKHKEGESGRREREKQEAQAEEDTSR